MKAATALAKMTSEAPKQKPAMERRRKRRRRQRKREERTSQGSRNSRWPWDIINARRQQEMEFVMDIKGTICKTIPYAPHG